MNASFIYTLCILTPIYMIHVYISFCATLNTRIVYCISNDVICSALSLWHPANIIWNDHWNLDLWCIFANCTWENHIHIHSCTGTVDWFSDHRLFIFVLRMLTYGIPVSCWTSTSLKKTLLTWNQIVSLISSFLSVASKMNHFHHPPDFTGTRFLILFRFHLTCCEK